MKKRQKRPAALSGRVTANCRALRERRERLAAAFRERLERELGSDGDSVGRDALSELAVSAYVEVYEVSAQFRQGRASPAAMQRLSHARGQLTRALRQLGVIERDDGDAGESEDTPSLAQYLAKKEATTSDDHRSDG
jgi:hypothetical protein